MDRGYLVKVAVGAVVSALSFVGIGGCGGRYEIGKDKNGANGGLELLNVPRPEKIDFLFMIDNSSSMAEKQRLLSQAVGGLVASVATPRCIAEDGTVVGSKGPNTPCDEGRPEFNEVRDIHIGVITSSLGDHGSEDICSGTGTSTSPGANFNDAAQLLPTVRSGLTSSDGTGFLAWDTSLAGETADLDELVGNFGDHVTRAGEFGCGFEASLEAWYRFLVDPEPVTSMSNDGRVGLRGPTNGLILEQRAAFLRPDSLVVIVMLTDENDCSIVDEHGTQGWLIPYKGGPNVNTWRMPRAHSSCATNPNAPTCMPCSPGYAQAGCAPGDDQLPPLEDPPNLRCFRQKERFGIDLLYPTERYVSALTETQIDPRYTGALVVNPLARTWAPPILAGVVGVPWQDLATPESHSSDALTYLSAKALAANDRWELMLGRSGTGRDPADPFMLESVDPRPGDEHPLLPGVRPEPPNLDNSAWNPINGHEQDPGSTRHDLQFACTFPLETAVVCTDDNDGSCPCNENEFEYQSPLCDYGGDPAAGVQRMTGAYPSTRHLEVLKRLGDQAVTTSICPKSVVSDSPETDPNYGYNPAMAAVAERIKQTLTPECRDEPLPMNDAGHVSCRVYEVTLTDDCSCVEENGRHPVSPETTARARGYLEYHAQCGGIDQPWCKATCACEIHQFDEDELETCWTSTADPGGLYGFCYIDPEAGVGSEHLVSKCPAENKRILRFLGANVPAKEAVSLISCSGG